MFYSSAGTGFEMTSDGPLTHPDQTYMTRQGSLIPDDGYPSDHAYLQADFHLTIGT